MAHKLLKFYSAFGGLDTSPNLLKQNPESVRRGSKNFRWNYTDQLQKREGFQHKTANESAAEIGLIEYKFKDINTGESKTEILGVAADGHLRKLRKHKLKLTRLNTSLVAYYSLFYDSQAATHKIVFYSASSSILGSVNIGLTDTLNSLKNSINGLSLNITADVVDDSLTPVVASTVLAYLLDVVDKEEFAPIGTQDIEYNEAWYWELVSTPDGQPAFVNAISQKDNVDYEGISYINSNNAVYITDGGFVFKYDGISLYRAGMPKTYENVSSSINLTPVETYSGNKISLFQDPLSFSGKVGWVAISNSSPRTITINNSSPNPATFTSSFAVSDFIIENLPIKFTTTGSLPAPLVAGTQYYVKSINPGGLSFTVSDSIGGAAIVTTSAGSGVHTCIPKSAFCQTLAQNPLGGFLPTDTNGIYVNMPIVFGGAPPPSPLVIGTTYYVTAVWDNFFTVSATVGGPEILTTSSLSFNSYTAKMVEISNTSPIIITFPTRTLDGYQVGMTLSLNTTGTLPSPLQPYTTYYVNRIGPVSEPGLTLAANQFTISTSRWGSNISWDGITSGSGSHGVYPDIYGFSNGSHHIRLQLVHKDQFGNIIYGKVQPLTSIFDGQSQGFMSLTTTSETTPVNPDIIEQKTFQRIQFTFPYIKNDNQFPVYACKVNGNQIIASNGIRTLNVFNTHNLKVGMALRLREFSIVSGQNQLVKYAEITEINLAKTEIKINVPNGDNFYIYDGQVLNGCYVPSVLFGKTELDFVPYGASWQLYISAAGTDPAVPGPFYKAQFFDVPTISTDKYTNVFAINDTDLTIKKSTVIDGKLQTKFAEEFSEETDAGEDLPRSCKYLSLWQNQIIQAGRPVDPSIGIPDSSNSKTIYPTVWDLSLYLQNLVKTQSAYYFFFYTESHLCDFQSIYWADSIHPEGFSQSGLAEESFENLFNDKITGMAPNKEALFVFKNRTTAYLTGSLASGDIVKEFLEADVGCATHNAIQEIRGTIVFMDENFGFWSVVAGRLPEFIGYPIQDFFKENYKEPKSSFLNFKRAKATNYRSKDLYICYIPAGPTVEPTSDSVAFLFDYSADKKKIRSCWYAWQDLNAAGGILSSANDELIISSRQTSGNRLWKQKSTGGIYDFSDHTSPIEFNYLMAFLTLDYPVIDKSWHRIIINSIAGGFDLLVKQYGNFMSDLIGDYLLSFPSSNKTTVKQDVKAVIPKLSGISFGFYNNTIHQDVEIEGWEIEYSADFDIGEPKK